MAMHFAEPATPSCHPGSTSPLVFEGPNLDAVLEKILRQVGPDAKISAAAKIRRGGVAGFFAKESYVITLAHTGDAQSQSLSYDASNRIRTEDHPLPSDRTAQGHHGVDQAISRPSGQTKDISESTGLIGRWHDLADATTDTVDISAEISTGQLDSGTPACKTQAGDAKQPTSVELDMSGRAPAPMDRSPEGGDPSFPAVLATILEATGPKDGPGGQRPRPLTLRPIQAKSNVASELAAWEPERIRSQSDLRQSDTPGPSLKDSPGAHGVRTSLMRLGLPTDLLPDPSLLATSGNDVAAALLKSLSHLPPPPQLPKLASTIFCVVGGYDQVLRLTGRFAQEMGTDPDEIALIVPSTLRRRSGRKQVLTNASAVSEMAPGWRRRSRPTLVALASSLASPSRGWLASVLEALRPDVLWACVQASTKTADVALWARSIGGVDALVVEGQQDTSTPAEILGSGIPVARLDGLPATEVLWTAILTNRLGC